MKRDNPTLLDLYGHWWVEAGEESWGWWPREVPVGVRQLARGTHGILNGVGLIDRAGTWSRDAQHGEVAAHAFHPVLVDPIPDDKVAALLRSYAQGHSGPWRWAWTRRGEHSTCRSFQHGLLQAAGLTEGLEHLASRGSGCPFLYPPRTLLWRAQDASDAARRRWNLTWTRVWAWNLPLAKRKHVSGRKHSDVHSFTDGRCHQTADRCTHRCSAA